MPHPLEMQTLFVMID